MSTICTCEWPGEAECPTHPPDVLWIFTYSCKTCGSTVQVVDGESQPHRCRIDLDAQRGSA